MQPAVGPPITALPQAGPATAPVAIAGQRAFSPGVGLFVLAAAWLGGVALQLRQATLQLPSPALWAATLCAAALAVACIGRAWPRLRGRWLWPVLALWVGAAAFVSTEWRAAARLADRLPAALEGSDLWLTGVVADLPRLSATGTRFVFEPEAASLDGRAVALPHRVALGWYRNRGEAPDADGPETQLRAGQRWQLRARLQQPHGGLNPDGFDYELYLFERGIGATGTVRVHRDAQPRKLADAAGYPLQRLRQTVRDGIRARIDDPVAAGVVAALAIGDQFSIDRSGWDVFRSTGVSHLMSISGLHVTMLAWLASLVVGRLWRLSPVLMLRLPAPQAARWSGLAAALGYALLAGWGVPAQRTVGMLAVVVLLRSAGLRWPLQAVLAAAAWVVTVIDPWALLQPGFWLSFGAVALLVASEPARNGGAAARPSGWRARAGSGFVAGLRTQAVATVGLAPLSMVFFQQISVVGFVANAVAIPLVTLLVTPLALAGVLLPWLWPLAGWLVHGLMSFLQMLAGWPLALWTAAVAPPWAMAAGLLAGLLAVLPLPWRLRALALPLMLPLLLPPPARPAVGRFELIAADIGQGTAVLVRTQSHLLVFDTGPAYSADSDAGQRVLLPLLRARGESRVDLLVLSHRDADHVGGAAALMAGVPVSAISSSLSEDHPLLQPPAPPHTRCEAGQQWQWDGVQFRMLQPLAGDEGPSRKSNALSCVLRIEGEGGSALLTGDIEAAQEAALVQREGAALHSDVLLVPHHGSRTSSTADFINTVSPRVAVVQAAYRSRFGHPAPDVVARYVARDIELVRSDRCGAWTLAADGASHCERDTARRYWHWRSLAAE